MKNKLQFKILLLVALAVSGCSSVPSTKLGVNPQTGVFTLDSPKEITLSNLDITLPNQTHFMLSNYASHNSPEVLATVAAANALMADKLLQLVDKIQALTAQNAKTAIVP